MGAKSVAAQNQPVEKSRHKNSLQSSIDQNKKRLLDAEAKLFNLAPLALAKRRSFKVTNSAEIGDSGATDKSKAAGRGFKVARQYVKTDGQSSTFLRTTVHIFVLHA